MVNLSNLLLYLLFQKGSIPHKAIFNRLHSWKYRKHKDILVNR
jgi:hypothetical protein